MEEKLCNEKLKTSFLGRAARLAENIAIVALVIFASLIFLQILLRNLFAVALVQIEELAKFFHLMMIFLVIPILYREGAHIHIDLLMNKLPPAGRKILSVIISLVTLVFAIAFMYSYSLFMGRGWNIPLPATGMPNLIYFGAIGIGMSLLVLSAIEKLWLELTLPPGGNAR